MTIEEITQTLQTVAGNQARHSADIAEIDRMLAASLRSQNRYDERLAQIGEIMHDLADKHLKNEERFAEFAAERTRHEARMAQLEASYELFEGFVRDFRNETNERFARTDGLFAETDKKLTALASAQAKTDEQMKRTDELVGALTRDIAAVNGRVDRTDERLDRAAEQISALAEAQTRTDEQIRLLIDRNGSSSK